MCDTTKYCQWGILCQIVPHFSLLTELCRNNVECTIGVRSTTERTFYFRRYYMKRVLSLCLIMLLVLTVITACSPDVSDKDNQGEHIHTYSSKGYNNYTHYFVTNCKEHEELRIEGEHEYDTDNYEVITKPTCTTTGKLRYTCKICGFNEHYEYPKVEHEFEQTKIIKRATCSAGGIVLLTCKNCSYSKEEKVSPSGHEFQYAPSWDDSSFIHNAYHLLTCQKCSTQQIIYHGYGTTCSVCNRTFVSGDTMSVVSSQFSSDNKSVKCTLALSNPSGEPRNYEYKLGFKYNNKYIEIYSSGCSVFSSHEMIWTQTIDYDFSSYNVSDISICILELKLVGTLRYTHPEITIFSTGGNNARF